MIGRNAIFFNYHFHIKLSKNDMAKIQNDEAQTTLKAASGHPLSARLDRLRLRHLRLMDLISRLGSLSAAAQELQVSQPGATKMLQEVEAAFGQPLIERTTKGGRLTAAGVTMLDRLRVALQAVSSARESLRESPQLPLVRLGVLPFVGISALCSVVTQLEGEGRLPRIHLRQGPVEALLLALHRGEVDCAVTVMETIERSEILHQLEITTLWEEPLVVVASRTHPILQQKKLGLRQLREQDWILMPHGTTSRQTVDRMFLREGMPPPIARIETESFHTGLSLVAASRQIIAVPYSAYLHYRSQVELVPLKDKLQSGAIVFVTLAGSPKLPAVSELSRCFQRFGDSYPDKKLTRPVA